MTVDDVIAAVFVREGWPRVTNRLSDRGGLTKGGITLQTLSVYLGRPVTMQELIDLSEQDARDLYIKVFIIAPGLDAIDDPQLQAFMVDYAVHSGSPHAIRDLQQALGVVSDGVFGPITKSHLATMDAAEVLLAVWTLRSEFLHRLALDNADVKVFLRTHPASQLHNLAGWNNRLLGFL